MLLKIKSGLTGPALHFILWLSATSYAFTSIHGDAMGLGYTFVFFPCMLITLIYMVVLLVLMLLAKEWKPYQRSFFLALITPVSSVLLVLSVVRLWEVIF